MAGVTFKLTGTREMGAELKRLSIRHPKRVGRALRIEGEEIMTLAKQKFVPVDLGTLSGSGFVEGPEFSGSDIEVRMMFGGAAAPYATAVHEHDSIHSPPSWRGKTIRFRRGGVKYLERPMKERSTGMANRIARAVRL